MSANLNKVTLIGRLGQDPETRNANGTDFVTFSVAVNGKRGGQEETEWFRCASARESVMAAVPYLVKGSAVYLEGKLRTRKWAGQDGVERVGVEVQVSELLLIDNPGSTTPTGNGNGASSNVPAPTQSKAPVSTKPQAPLRKAQAQAPVDDIDPDDLPF